MCMFSDVGADVAEGTSPSEAVMRDARFTPSVRRTQLPGSENRVEITFLLYLFPMWKHYEEVNGNP